MVIEEVASTRDKLTERIDRFSSRPSDVWSLKQVARLTLSAIPMAKYAELRLLQIVDVRLPELQKLFVEG